MQIQPELLDKIANRAIEASKRISPKFEQGQDAWRECVGYIVVQCIERLSRRPEIGEIEKWLVGTCFGEARKYYRNERRDCLAK